MRLVLNSNFYFHVYAAPRDAFLSIRGLLMEELFHLLLFLKRMVIHPIMENPSLQMESKRLAANNVQGAIENNKSIME